jgi:hypothetical protein
VGKYAQQALACGIRSLGLEGKTPETPRVNAGVAGLAGRAAERFDEPDHLAV